MSEEQIRSLMQHDRETGERAIYDAYYTYVYAIVYRRISGIGTREDVEECVKGPSPNIMSKPRKFVLK